MAKARRTVRTEHEDGSATIDLAAPAPETPLEPTDKLPDYGSEEAQQAADKPQPKAHRTSRREMVDDDAAPTLEDQIKTLKAAEKTARERADQERFARLQAEQARNAEAQRARQEVEQSHLDLVANTLEGQQSALVLAKQEYAAARVNNDPLAEADAMERMNKISNKIATLEAGKDEMERRKQAPSRQQPQVQPGPPNVENVLAQMPGLTNEEREWVRSHPDAVTDQAQVQRMQVAWADSQRLGIRRNSPEYFRFFDERLGYDSNDQDQEYDDVDQDEPAPQPRPRPRGPVTAAPVSRSSPGASTRDAPRSGQVTLTKEEREAAKFSNIDERTYAENKRKLLDLKRRGYYQEQG